jgi:glycosyltransferase involved in cell wall biosynthesis
MKRKLAIFGPYPPPLGGVSVHIQRMEQILKIEKIDYTVYNHYSKSGENIVPTHRNLLRYFKFLFKKEYAVFHFHFIFYFEFFFYFIFSMFNKTPFLITFHGEALLFKKKWKQKIALYFLRKSKPIIVISVSKALYEFLGSKRIKTIYLPAYVPPLIINPKKVPKDERKLFMFSVWKVDKKTAIEVYNIPLAFEFLKNNKSRYKMLFLVGNKDISDIVFLNQLINKFDLSNEIILLYNENLVDYVQNCDFLLRTNTVDGYGVSLQEAMDLGVPAIASDVCERPKGTVLFKNNDLKDLSQKTSYVLNTTKTDILKDKEILNYHKILIDIYIENLN